jgi:phosphohistidine phosphatase SixA
MIFVLLRHAHRDTSNRAADNGLSAKGKDQRRLLLEHFKSHFGKSKKVVLFSSPKKRCVETIQPIAEYLKADVVLSDLLMEGGARGELLKRARRFFATPFKADIVVICSHGDWLPVALHELCGATADLKKGSWAEVHDGKLQSLLQPDDLG